MSIAVTLRSYNIYRIAAEGPSTRTADGVFAASPEDALLGFFDGTALMVDGGPSYGPDIAAGDLDQDDLFFVAADAKEGEDGYHSYALLAYHPAKPARVERPEAITVPAL